MEGRRWKDCWWRVEIERNRRFDTKLQNNTVIQYGSPNPRAMQTNWIGIGPCYDLRPGRFFKLEEFRLFLLVGEILWPVPWNAIEKRFPSRLIYIWFKNLLRHTFVMSGYIVIIIWKQIFYMIYITCSNMSALMSPLSSPTFFTGTIANLWDYQKV